RAARGRVMEAHPWILGEPGLDSRGAVCGGVVEDDVEAASRFRARHLLQKREKVRGGVAVLASVHDFAAGDVEGRVKVDDAVTLVVMRVSGRATLAERKR